MIKAIKAENFLSWENLSFVIRDGVTLIDGFNRDDSTSEGSGKSAVLNALCWGLYGKIPKDSNVDDVIKHGEKGCMVEVIIENAIICRSRKPNDLKIITKDNTNLKGKDARETQKMVEELIGMSFDAFCQTIYFAQNYPKKFITATQDDKGKILSEIQDLQIFDKARKEVLSLQKLTQDGINSIQMELREANLKADHCAKEIEYIKQQDLQQQENRTQQCNVLLSQIEQYKTNIDEKVKEINELKQQSQNTVDPNDIIVLDSNIGELDQIIAGLKSDINNIDSHNKQLFNLQNQKNTYNRQASSLISKIDKLQNFINDPSQKCPTCGTELDQMDTSHAEKELEDLQNQLHENGNFLLEIDNQINDFNQLDKNELTNQLNDKTNERSKLVQAKNQIQSINNEIQNTVNKINMLEQNILTFNQYIEQTKQKHQALLDTPLTDFQPQISNKTNELISYREQVISLENLLIDKQSYFNRLSDLKNGFKEVKSYTFNSVLAELTIKSNKYLQELFEVPMSIKFTNDNMKIGTEVTMNGESRGLGLLSGGQFRRTCLAVDLALSEIVALRTGSKMNIRVLDEYFKDLSESSMEKCLRLLEKLGGSTILIEHNSIFKSIVDNVFECELVNGTSRSVI